MKVTVHLGEPYWRAINARTIELTLSAGSSVAAMLLALFDQYPALAPDLREGEVRPVIFVDDHETQPETPLADGAQIHIVWPISGG